MKKLFAILLMLMLTNLALAESRPNVDRLIKGLEDDSWSVKVKSALNLGRIKDERAVEPLINALNDENYYVRKYAANALIKIGRPSFDLLTVSLQDTNWRVRKSAAYALGEMNDCNAARFLVNALGDENLYVANEVKTALIKIGEPSVNSVIVLLGDKDIDAQKNAGYILSQIGRPAVQPLIDMLKNANSYGVVEAIWTLGEIGDSRAVKPLLLMLKNKNNMIRWEAVSALGKIGDEKIVGFIKPMLNDEDNHIKSAAKEIIEELKSGGRNKMSIAAFKN